MKRNDIITGMKRSLNTTMFKAKKHSPTILVVGGIIGVVTSTVMACRATTKIEAILEETNNSIEMVHNALSDEKYKDKYTEADGKKDLTLIYVQTGIKLVKLYAPSAIVGAASILSIIYSHKILSKRNVALAAAYAAVDKGFKDYRGRVIERFGENIDKELRYNIKAKEFEEIVIDENGNEVITKKNVDVIADGSEYAKFFDVSSREWEKDPEQNLMFLKGVQNAANDILRVRGHLTLNEVYRMLDIPETKAGMVVGWIYDPKHPVGDNFVDFGIYKTNKECNRRFVNGYEPTILLDFNVDGNIYDLM